MTYFMRCCKPLRTYQRIIKITYFTVLQFYHETKQLYNILKKTLLVEEVVVHFDLRIGLEVVWHEHDGNLNMT